MMVVNDEFIDRILDGEASAGEMAELERWLETPGNLERFALRAELHADLRRSLRRRSIQENALQECGDDRTALETSSAGVSYTVLRSRPWVVTVGGLVAAACLLLAVMQWKGDEDREATESRVASVVSDVDSLLTKDDQRWQDASLPAGDYQLERGLLNLRFGGGVLVYLEAPARFAVVSRDRVVLYRGRLSANVPPEGIGFTVETPEAEVVDYGTQFSVDVESGSSEVHVFDGLVRVHPGATKTGEIPAAVDLQASQAVRITGKASSPVGIELAKDRFIRNFDEPKRKYARSIKQLSPVAFYRMPIRDRGLVAEPPEYSGVVLTGDGIRPPHARGVFMGGSLRVKADSTGRGGRVDTPPPLDSGQLTLAVFVYLETESGGGMVATNFTGNAGNFELSLVEGDLLQAAVRSTNGEIKTIASETSLVAKTWHHVVMTADGERLRFYLDGRLVGSTSCGTVAAGGESTMWFGTDAALSRLWNGRIDELALFDEALSEAEIVELYRIAGEEVARTR